MNPGDALISLILLSITAGLGGVLIIKLLRLAYLESIVSRAKQEAKRQSLSRFSVPYDQDADDNKPKRYMTIGDDGELVEMDQ